MARPVDPDLIADEECRQQHNRPDPFEVHLALTGRHILMLRLAHRTRQRQTARSHPLDPGRVLSKDWLAEYSIEKEST
jgi:hypothetical protein